MTKLPPCFYCNGTRKADRFYGLSPGVGICSGCIVAFDEGKEAPQAIGGVCSVCKRTRDLPLWEKGGIRICSKCVATCAENFKTGAYEYKDPQRQ